MNSWFPQLQDYFTWKPGTVVSGKSASVFYTSQPTHTMVSEAVAQFCPPLEFQPFFSMRRLLWYSVGSSEFTMLPYLCLYRLETQELHALSQSVTDFSIYLLSLNIPSKEGNKSRMQLFNKFDESRKIFLLEKRNPLSILYLMFSWTKEKNFFKCMRQGQNVEFHSHCSPFSFIF